MPKVNSMPEVNNITNWKAPLKSCSVLLDAYYLLF